VIADGRAPRAVSLRDSTLREGFDTPGVSLSLDQRVQVASLLAAAGVDELEVVAPARVAEDVAAARRLAEAVPELRTSGLLYAHGSRLRGETELAREALDRFDLLAPLVAEREPRGRAEKVTALLKALEVALEGGADVGAGFPHSTQVNPALVVEIAAAASERGARRITVYDTNGSGDPFGVRDIIRAVTQSVDAPVFFHGHNDLGLATANSLAAVLGGASGLDVTVNGLGDRAGNASLEQVAVCLASRDIEAGVRLDRLGDISRRVAELSGVPLSPLAPVVGEHVFSHRSQSHRQAPSLFEAFDPDKVGGRRIVAPE
jgi:homocitrate synthase NifV